MPNFIKKIQINPEKYPTSDYYPFSLPIFQQVKELSLDAAVTFFIGENGSGKSTLLEAIAQAADIHIWRSPSCVRLKINPFEKMLYHYLRIEWDNEPVPGSFWAAEIFREFRKNLEAWASTDSGQLQYFGGESLMTMSHGQSLMSYFQSRYKIKGVYFLDEPESALSPKNLLKLLSLIQTYSDSGHAQFVIATHSPILLSCQNAQIYSFDLIPIARINYKDTDHFKIYKQFLLKK